MIISTIVAVSNNYAIGKDNQIPWYLPADLKYFKKQTLNHHIIMGKNSYVSIGRPLPKRTNIILTRNPFYIVSNCFVFHSIGESLEFAKNNGEEEVFIIGGGTIYEQTKDLWDKVYITEVDVEIEDADTFFPRLETDKWNLISSEHHSKDEKNNFDYTFKILERKK